MQLQILESIFYQGSDTPNKQGIKDITAKLAEHCQISETNVYNWFQNRRARSKRKQANPTQNTAELEEAESLNAKRARTEKLVPQSNIICIVITLHKDVSMDATHISFVFIDLLTLLIVLIIWKISPAKSDADQPQQRTELDLPPGVEDPALELSWYSPPSNEPAAPEEAEREVAMATENPSMDDAWRAIVAGRGKRVLRKSETWERRGRGDAERAAAAALRRSDTAKGWRRREKLVESQEELLQRVEKFIEKHYDHLRLQKQESESRRFLERQLLRH
ncbi:hypothetical protein ZIOFF_041692 [Zingiber officinale]|uniref:Homeobox domain-containing protein n=1 Tax=Zingiber officinale TaxID=94328 RepID=A0A8J5GHU6_ZINOF|nr:hypothetical protein ZIOFF_041692 [Zingiber officinale]